MLAELVVLSKVNPDVPLGAPLSLNCTCVFAPPLFAVAGVDVTVYTL
jgi:hypothetical protein